jgi:acyl-coenzyme A synthetase/AMP-(fatty) acid ligase
MYMAQVSSLIIGAHVVMYDGNPFAPNPLAFIKLLGEYKYVVF